jgi:hypothetical protein
LKKPTGRWGNSPENDRNPAIRIARVRKNLAALCPTPPLFRFGLDKSGHLQTLTWVRLSESALFPQVTTQSEKKQEGSSFHPRTTFQTLDGTMAHESITTISDCFDPQGGTSPYVSGLDASYMS